MINTINKMIFMQPKNNRMKILYLLATVAVVSLGGSCGASSKENKADLTDKKVELQKLKDQQVKTAEQIKKLEEEIVKIDPNAIPVKPKLVSITTLTTQNFSHYIELQARITSDNIAFVNPRNQGGLVKEVYVKQGDNVKKGQLLLKLDDAVVRQQIEQSKVQLDLANSTYQRRKNLWDQKIGSEQEFLLAKNNVESIEKLMDLLKEQLDMTNVYAEIPGTAESVTIKVGEFFSAQSAAQGQGIVIVNSSSLKAVVDIPENYLTRVRKGSPVLIVIPDVNKTFNSTISNISQVVNATSRGFLAEAKLPAGSNLKPGQVAIIRIQDYTASNAMAVPMNTVQTDQDGKYVYVVANENGKTIAKKRPVVVGELNGDQIEIRQGLVAGDKLITEGFQSLYDGQSITTESK
jgi:membrane fusion protein (multidrug efflux system)